MAILLTGGTGKTSIRLARMLQDSKIPFLLASRSASVVAPPGMPATKFDWLDPSTFANPFQHAFPNGEKISAIYLIAPEVSDPAPAMNALVDLAVEKHGVKRFVLLTGTSVEEMGYYTGPVWQHFEDIGVEYCVLRPTWFMENFSEWEQVVLIRDESKIYTACGDGKIPFISADDIAAVAFRALTDEKPQYTDYKVLGPELLSYNDIAVKFSKALGREITHVKLSAEEQERRLQKLGMSEQFAKLLTSLEVRTAGGFEEQMNDVVAQVTGRPPKKFDRWVQDNKATWE